MLSTLQVVLWALGFSLFVFDHCNGDKSTNRWGWHFVFTASLLFGVREMLRCLVKVPHSFAWMVNVSDVPPSTYHICFEKYSPPTSGIQASDHLLLESKPVSFFCRPEELVTCEYYKNVKNGCEFSSMMYKMYGNSFY